MCLFDSDSTFYQHWHKLVIKTEKYKCCHIKEFISLHDCTQNLSRSYQYCSFEFVFHGTSLTAVWVLQTLHIPHKQEVWTHYRLLLPFLCGFFSSEFQENFEANGESGKILRNHRPAVIFKIIPLFKIICVEHMARWAFIIYTFIINI